LADDSAVADGITSVLKVVEERTDLTFEQFRRTVLLAQGDFDAFLLQRSANVPTCLKGNRYRDIWFYLHTRAARN